MGWVLGNPKTMIVSTLLSGLRKVGVRQPHENAAQSRLAEAWIDRSAWPGLCGARDDAPVSRSEPYPAGLSCPRGAASALGCWHQLPRGRSTIRKCRCCEIRQVVRGLVASPPAAVERTSRRPEPSSSEPSHFVMHDHSLFDDRSGVTTEMSLVQAVCDIPTDRAELGEVHHRYEIGSCRRTGRHRRRTPWRAVPEGRAVHRQRHGMPALPRVRHLQPSANDDLAEHRRTPE